MFETVKKSIWDLAIKELMGEQEKEAIRKIKAKLKERAKAELILKNIDRELQDLKEQIENGDINF